MIDIEELNKDNPSKRIIFVDNVNLDFLIYLIDFKKYKIICYKTGCIIETIKLILQKYKEFNVDKVHFYQNYDRLYLIYEALTKNDISIDIRNDIYSWRMQLHSDIRHHTLPIYYYLHTNKYEIISENEYINLINNTKKEV